MTASFSPQQIKANRIKLALLWSVPFGLMAIAGIVYALVQAGYINVGSKNEGVLIQPPIQLSQLALASDIDPDKSNLWQDKWSIVVRGGADCDAACLDTFLLTRQIHIRLNKEANRVQRVYLAAAPSSTTAAPESLTVESALSDELSAHLATDNHYMKVAIANAAQLTVLDNALMAGDQMARFFVVDPDGWAMMYYLEEHEGGAILKDLKYLLKYSKER